MLRRLEAIIHWTRMHLGAVMNWGPSINVYSWNVFDPNLAIVNRLLHSIFSYILLCISSLPVSLSMKPLTFVLRFHSPGASIRHSILSQQFRKMGTSQTQLPQRLDEENNPDYTPRRFYPARVGEILNSKFQLISKLGWGTGSTVWLAQNVKR